MTKYGIIDYDKTFSEIRNLLINANFIEAKSKLQSLDESNVPSTYRFYYHNAFFEVLFKTHVDEKQFYESLKHLEIAADYTEDSEQKSTIYGNIAVYLIQRNKIDEVQKYLDKCFDYALSDSTKIFAYKVKGRVLYLTDALEDSLECFTEAAYFAEITHNEFMLFHITMEIAFVFESLNCLNVAFSECDRAEQYARLLKDLNMYYRCVVYKAQLLYKLGRLDDIKKLICKIPKSLD